MLNRKWLGYTAQTNFTVADNQSSVPTTKNQPHSALTTIENSDWFGLHQVVASQKPLGFQIILILRLSLAWRYYEPRPAWPQIRLVL